MSSQNRVEASPVFDSMNKDEKDKILKTSNENSGDQTNKDSMVNSKQDQTTLNKQDTSVINGQQNVGAETLQVGKKKLPSKSTTSDNTKSGNGGGETVNTKGNDEEEKLTLVNNLKKQSQLKKNVTDSPSVMTNPSKLGRAEIKIQNVSPIRRNIRKIVRSKPVLYVVIFLVIIYTIVIFVDITLQQLLDQTQQDSIDNRLRYVELVILIIFCIEIILNAYGTGLKNYFRDRWFVLDAIIILLSLALVIIDMTVSFGSKFTSVASIIRAIFRFLRIFLLLRKLQNFKKINVTSSIKTPSEKVLEILSEFKEYFDDTEIISDIDWSMKMIASNKLYEPVIGEGGDALLAAWSNQNQQKQDSSKNQESNQNNTQEKPVVHSNYNRKSTVNRIMHMPETITQKFIPAHILKEFEKSIDELTFNCFEIQKICGGQESSLLLVYLFDKFNLLDDLKIDSQKFINLSVRVQNGYRDNPYHDRLHSFDVTQTIHFFISKCKFGELAKLKSMERAAMYFSAAIHDFDHPGYNNVFLINTQNILALKFNDQSVLENHHVSSVYEMILKNNNLNIFSNFSNDEYKQFREMVVNMVLATDMTKHFTDISKLKSRIAATDFEIDGKDKKTVMESLLHASDISNPARPWEICYQWTNKVMTEFWAQGDEEKRLGLPVTYLCDRVETNTSKSQQGFIDFVVKPLFEIISNFLPELQQFMINFEQNKEKWAELLPKYEAQLKALKEDKEKNQVKE
ncbi:hypothetical protein ABPG72_005044 [Tetrahymena utriculariae]